MAIQLKTPLEERTEKELLISQTKLLIRSTERLEKIDNNLRFFFWVAIIGFVASIFMTITYF